MESATFWLGFGAGMIIAGGVIGFVIIISRG